MKKCMLVMAFSPLVIFSLTPKIYFTYIPLYGSSDQVQGKVAVNPADYKGITLYIYVPNWGWVVKPTFADSITPISSSDSSWTTNYVTGGTDQNATIFAAFLIPKTFSPPAISGVQTLPKSLYDSSTDSSIYYRSTTSVFQTLNPGRGVPGGNGFHLLRNQMLFLTPEKTLRNILGSVKAR